MDVRHTWNMIGNPDIISEHVKWCLVGTLWYITMSSRLVSALWHVTVSYRLVTALWHITMSYRLVTALWHVTVL